MLTLSKVAAPLSRIEPSPTVTVMSSPSPPEIETLSPLLMIESSPVPPSILASLLLVMIESLPSTANH
ncbi:MAG: hypothetical protein IJ774_02650 [Selenomonadaceae bacterium]|nr:hypothetical protein [Selenomonadaceae bacterium]